MSKKAAMLLVAVALAVAGILPAVAFAESPGGGSTFTEGGITYAVTGDGTVSVGSGKVGTRAIDTGWSGRLDIPATVEHGSSAYRVTSIAPYACAGCTSLSEVSIPASVTSIGFNAFGYCGTMDDSGDAPAFGGLGKVEFASGTQLAVIGENAFVEDYALRAFEIPASVTSIGKKAFQDCFSFERFACEEGSRLKGIAAHAFSATLPKMDPATVPSGGAGPGAWPAASAQAVSEPPAARSYAHLESVSLPASLNTLGDSAFANQRALTSLVWDDGCELESIGTGSFQYCTALESASVPALAHELNGLGPYSFQYCTSLKEFTYKGKIRAPYSGYSERGLFQGVTGLETVVYLADKRHEPFGTLAGDDYEVTARKTFTDCDPAVYYLVTFYDSAESAAQGARAVGSAIVREGTAWADMAGGLAGGALLSGSVPALGEGFGWACAAGGGATVLDNASAAYPVAANDLSGAGLSLSQARFAYTSRECKPEVVVTGSTGSPLAEESYVLAWERRKDDGTWEATGDFASPGTLRVSAAAARGSGYTGTTQPVEFTIAAIGSEESFVVDGITYTALTPSDSVVPTAMVGDGEHPAMSTSTTGSVSIPSKVRPDGSMVDFKVTQVGSFAFGSASAGGACDGIVSITVPEGVTAIGAGAFKNMAALKSVNLPASLSSIAAGAFENAGSLSSVNFAGKSIEMVGTRAFANCQELERFTLPDVTKLLNSLVFENCRSLEVVTFLGGAQRTLDNQFQGCGFLSAVVFCGDDPGFAFGDYVARYVRVTFEDESRSVLGTADILVGTALADIGAALPQARVIAGAVPDLPAGKGEWSFSLPGPVLTHAATATAAGTAADGGRGGGDAGGQPDGDAGAGLDGPKADAGEGGGSAGGSVKVSQSFTAGSKQARAVYKVTSTADRTVTYKACKSTAKAKATIPAQVDIEGDSYAVTKVAAKAFKASKSVKTVTVKSKRITSFKNAFKSSKVSKVKVPAAKRRAYAKLLVKEKSGRKVTVA